MRLRLGLGLSVRFETAGSAGVTLDFGTVLLEAGLSGGKLR